MAGGRGEAVSLLRPKDKMDLFYLRSTPYGHHARANTVHFLYSGEFFFFLGHIGLTSTKCQDVMVPGEGGGEKLLSGGYHFVL